jgi:hypothetical protein
MISSLIKKKQLEHAKVDTEQAAIFTNFATTSRLDCNCVDLSIDVLEGLARIRNLDFLLKEAQLVLPEFPLSLNLVIWAAYNINEADFAEEIRDYLDANNCSSSSLILSQDSADLRTCKALAEAVQLRASSLAMSLIEQPTQSVFVTTIEQAATRHMLDFLRALAMRSTPIYQVMSDVSMIALMRKSIQSVVTWDLVYEKVVAFCTEAVILTVLSWNPPIMNVVSPLCRHGYSDLGISLVIRRKAELREQETLELVKTHNTKFLVTLEKKLRPLRPKFLYCSAVCDSLTELISNPNLLLDALYLLRRIPAKNLTVQSLAHITRTLRSLLSLHPDNPLVEHWNPMLVSVACAHLCQKFAKYKFEFKHNFETMQVKFKALAVSYIRKFSEFTKVFLIYTDDSYPGGTLLDLMTARSSEYRLMLESDLVAAVVEHLWSGNAKRIMMHVASPLFHLYKAKDPDKIFAIHNSYKMKREVSCIFSYSAWKFSAEMRFWIESLYLVVVLARVIQTIQTFAESNLVLYDWAETPQNQIDAANDLKYEKFIMWLCFCYFCVVQVRTVYDWIFQWLNKQKVRLSKRNFIDTGLFVSMLVAVYKIENSPEDVDQIEGVFAIVLMLICIKACLVMLITKHFGPVLRSIGIIVVSAFKYIFLFLLSVVAFTLVFFILFYRKNEKFKSIGETFTVLFDFSAGNLNFDIYGDRHDLGTVLTVVWTFVSMVTLLNIIVAYITNRYASMEPQANADYASLLYFSYKYYKYNDNYSGLVMYPVPTNVLVVLLSPLYVVLSNVHKLNQVLMAVSYVQMFIIALSLFTLYNLVMIPLVYLKTLFGLLGSTLRDRSYFSTLVKWLLFGTVYELYLSVLAYRYVVPLLLKSKIKPITNELHSEMLQETLEIATRFLRDQEPPVIVPLNKILEALTEKDQDKGFFDVLRSARRKMTIRASLFHNVIKDYLLCNQVEFIEQFLWLDNYDDKSQQVNVSLLAKMLEDLASNSTRLIPVNVSGIQRSLMKFRKKSR